MKSTVLAIIIPGVLGFRAETGGLLEETLNLPLPMIQNLSTSNSFVPNTTNSWWSSSYVHASNNHDYLIVSQCLLMNAGLYRGSILDITDPSFYRQFERFATGPLTDPGLSSGGILNITFEQYGFHTTNYDDPLQELRTWSAVEGVEFDIRIHLSTPVILNGGTGLFQWGSELTHEWSMPAGLTLGSFVVNGSRLTIDPTRSLTWYDRQLMWPNTLAKVANKANWTWFEVHLDDNSHNNNAPTGRADKLSIWVWDTTDHRRTQFATARHRPGIHQVLPVTAFVPSRRTWTSPVSKATYPLDWVVTLWDGTTLSISSVRPDQELCDATGLSPTYEGYIQVNGFDGDGRMISGYGLVEQVPAGFLPAMTLSSEE
ncbi:uncharacterized protein BO95DRAFT_438921 [Aspergillus brunneoviolaceus CBS 621.78]|uniref:Uncharacterized protein n=1 Tax=Aspergillus brunneoviolaceus CBS 621.78 TaxID=1450534 RepID=A0ACD1GKC1_9EURO|nr:hypothetical protein BO95DRAFT_438921 [Aspergillus brunneoviolaceus CBS 621.78]RAH49708.1 hypothetical protein BO95DRAFT_438921 [Aspergillus brunneoviolaceus CBS 621.78]